MNDLGGVAGPELTLHYESPGRPGTEGPARHGAFS